MAAKKKSRSTRARAEAAPDAIALLSADHRKVEKLFKQYEKADGNSKKAALAEQICTELEIHTLLEEEIFYPACRKKGVETDDLEEAQVEHDSAKVLIADLKEHTPRDQFYDAKMTVLTEYIKHHVQEEERPRRGVFAQARSSGVDLQSIGRQIEARKSQLTEEAQASQLPKPTLRSLTVASLVS
ncbi:MAG TPA: hemerythrin domain-containing protein [Steroidobacteraceae bacterium]|jgi:hypothetical protein|nr:hemerythrin domain-containing protein [Steroidobacteraceae bacterium]